MRLIILFGLVFLLILLWYLRHSVKIKRQEKLFKTPLDAKSIAALEKSVTLYNKLPLALREELHGHINIFLDSKMFIGRNIEVTDEMRVVVAGNACLLLLQGKNRRFNGFSTILIYPSAYMAREVHHDGLLTTEQPSVRAGESWMGGPVVLSWEDVEKGSINADDGQNVVIHEFAHKLDEQSGYMNGLPILAHASDYKSWNKILTEEFKALHERAKRGSNKVLDAYGTVSPAEFFAVASESFFEKPTQMKKRLPDLYQQLTTFYKVDPTTWELHGAL